MLWEEKIRSCPRVDKDIKRDTMTSRTVEVYPIIMSQYCHFWILMKFIRKYTVSQYPS